MQKKAIILAILYALSFSPPALLLRSPILPHPYPETFTHPHFPLQIHSSVESNTGLIVVGEALTPPDYDPEDLTAMHSVRYLRAAHSILGGVWTGPRVAQLGDEFGPVKDSFGNDLGDSIYGAFVLQEASRLLLRGESAKRGKGRALTIGLGTGVSTIAFRRQGMNTTVLEIDPAVYDAARRFFGLPDLGEGNVFLEDAGGWVASRAKAQTEKSDDSELYDIIVHDCFSGGGIPQHLYTIEFFDDLKKITKPDGVVVVNFAGEPDSEPSRLLLRTLDEAFPQCRAFHDLQDPAALTEDKYSSNFVNVVFFCSNKANPPLKFRSPTSADYLGSYLRRHFFESLNDREVELGILRASTARIKEEEGKETKVLSRKEGYNPLGKMQEAQAAKHWNVMRMVLPDIYWETF